MAARAGLSHGEKNSSLRICLDVEVVLKHCVLLLQHVYLDHSTYAPPPSRFEPGTPAIAEAVGLGAAIDYLQEIGMQNVQAYEHNLGGHLHDRVSLLLLLLCNLCSPPASRCGCEYLTVLGLDTMVRLLRDMKGHVLESRGRD